ncbi:3-oxoacyl-ACP synthase III family protein [Membranihabitans maritimus]|uniref:3-oxoacyl-ACP synthase III family protein n=1 Tax=Membranihabitans maritimus TaxID=2904244 RepID=UPI001F272C75|nr:ketoacyl-ACP synthase III [Membranihabitans maritimus]
MNIKPQGVITGTGTYIPTRKIPNEHFLKHEFFSKKNVPLNKSNPEILDKFKSITTIEERRYVTDDLVTSDIAYFAAKDAIIDSGINSETLDYIIVAHNFGDVKKNNNRSDIVPSLAARVKQNLGIKNPDAVAYDITFGCPGWLQALIQANYYIKSGDAQKILVIGAEVLSRVSDPHDRDSMLYADGAGAIILENKGNEPNQRGILAHKTRSDTYNYSHMLHMNQSYGESAGDNSELFLKMNGRKLYQYALETVPQSIKSCLDSISLHIDKIKKIFIHQANGKMDDAILQRLYALYDIKDIPEFVMPMTVSWLGNSSVATLPTLLDLTLKGKLENHKIETGDTILFASVGAGMNINALIYKV